MTAVPRRACRCSSRCSNATERQMVAPSTTQMVIAQVLDVAASQVTGVLDVGEKFPTLGRISS